MLNNQYRTIRDSAGLLKLAEFSILNVTGKDRARFLHGLLSNDIKALKEGEGCLAAMLSSQGKTLALLQVLCLESSFWLLVETKLIDKVQAHLQRYIISDKVEIAPATPKLSILSLQGSKAIDMIRGLFSPPEPFKPSGHYQANLGGSTVRIFNSDRSGWGGIDLILPENNEEEAERFIFTGSPDSGIEKVSREALNLHRVEAGIPWFGIDLNENQIPLEAGLKNTISYTKGCYLGQEIIARATYRGHLNRKLMGVVLEGVQPAAQGSQLFQVEKEVGFTTSSVYSPALQSGIALAYLRLEAWEPGTELQLKKDSDSRTAKVTELPFVAT